MKLKLKLSPSLLYARPYVRWPADRLPVRRHQFNDVTTIARVSPGGPWLVGGSVRRELEGAQRDCDYDFAFNSPQQLEECFARFEAAGFYFVREKDAFVELQRRGVRVQLTRLHYANAIEAIMDTFDFTLCQTGYDGESWVFGPDTEQHINERRIVLRHVNYGATSLQRLCKYGAQGYHLDAADAVAFAKAMLARPKAAVSTMSYGPEGAAC